MSFVAGERFGRYVVASPLGQGAMGEVYRARDTRLERDVALKVLRGDDDDGASTDEGRARLLREARAAAALDHPNVVAVFDVGEIDEVMFLAMELIRGRTLRELAAGDAPVARRLAWLCDVARALASAHKSGLVHRDIKPENVMVRDDGVVKVLDFGIARRTGASAVPPAPRAGSFGSIEDLAAAARTEGRIVGTPLYMGPELMDGRAADERADQFSWGVVAYEILSGRLPWPFRGTLVAYWSDVRSRAADPIDPRARGVPEPVCAAVTRAIDRDPERRFASMEEVVEILEEVIAESVAQRRSNPREDGLRAPSSIRAQRSVPLAALPAPPLPLDLPAPPSFSGAASSVVASVPRRRHTRLALIAAAAVLASAAAVTLWIVQPRDGAPAAALRDGRLRRAIAVLGFRNLSGRAEAAWISTAVAEMMVTEIGAGGALRTIASENVARARTDLELPDADSLAPDTLARVRKHTGAELVVLGSYLALGGRTGGRVRLDVRVQDAATGEILVSASETGEEGDIFDLVTRAGAQIQRGLRLGVLGAGDVASARAIQAHAPEAQRLHAEGLARLRAHDALGARALFERAVAADPTHALGHAALADALAALGYDDLAKAEALRAFELSEPLPQRARMLVEARYRGANREWAKAIEIYRALADASPDDLDAGLRVASAQTSGERGKDALSTLAALRRLPAPLGDDPRIDLAEAEAHNVLGDMVAAGRAAAEAARGARARSALHLVARARALAGAVLASTGAAAEARAAIDEAKQTFARAGDARGVADATASLGLLEAWRRNHAEAIPLLEQAIERYRVIGNRAELCTSSANLATARFDAGALDGAARALDEIHAASCQRADLGVLRMVRGLVLRARGDLRAAEAAYGEARADFRSVGDRRLEAWADAALGDLCARQDRRAEARELLERSLRAREAGELRQLAAESRLLLADLALDEGQAAHAEALARAAEAALSGEQVGCDQAQAALTVAAAERAQGRDGAAHATIERARPLVTSCQSPTIRLRFAVAAGSLRPADPGAMGSLEAARAEAADKGFVEIALQAERAMGELALAGGNRVEARVRLAAAEKAATEKGFVVLAREIQKAAR